MKPRSFNPLKLDVEAFAREGASLEGEWPATSLPRLAESAAPESDPAHWPPVRWTTRGETRTPKGGEPQIWLELGAEAQVALTCQRCLKPVREDLAVSRWFRFVKDEDLDGRKVERLLPDMVEQSARRRDEDVDALFQCLDLRIDPDAGLLEAGETVADDWNRFPNRLLCTGGGDLEGPTIILEPYDWIDYGSWSVVQAQLSNQGHLVCSNGYLDGEASPKRRAAALNQALIEAGISGPLVLVANGDGVHTTRLFDEARADVVGVVLVDPMPVGFGDFLEEQAGDHPPFADLDPATSAALDFGEVPLVVVGQDPEKVFLSPQFIAGFGLEKARVVNDYWQDGLAFYRGLSTDVSSRVAAGTGMHMVIWDQPGLVVEEVLNVISRGD